MKKTSVFILLSFISVCLSSCGVMFGGSRFNATVDVKDHPNAQIFVDGAKIGQGKGVTVRPRNVPFVVEVRQEGCQTKTQTFQKTFRTGNFILSAFTWGILGIAVDLASGASFKPDHKTNPAIQKLSEKEYNFIVDYSECPTNN